MTSRNIYDVVAFAGFIVLATLFLVGGFVGLGDSSYWIDELFTLYVVDPTVGWSEVLRRALTDNHPPGYYFLAHIWTGLVGAGEASARALSAGLLAASLPILFFGLRGELTPTARAFVVALAGGSRVYFEQSQNLRSYGLVVLLATVLLSLALMLRRQAAAREFRTWTWLAFGLVSLLASFTHFYLFLVVGATHLVLLAGARTVRDRVLLLASGAVIAAAVAIYVLAMMSSGEASRTDTWFSNSPSELLRQAVAGVLQSWSWGASLAVALLALVAVAAPRNREVDRLPLARLCVMVIAVTLLAALIVSFVVAPSFGKRNLIVLAPFLWVLAGCFFDVAMSSRRRPVAARVLLGVVVMLTASNLLVLRYRQLPRQEDWRGSAAYVRAEPSCESALIPVVLPPTFGPPTPFYRSLAKVNFYGFYDARPDRLVPFTLGDLSPERAPPDLAALWAARGVGTGCPVLAWAVHVSNWDGISAASLANDISVIAGTPPGEISVRTFPRYEIGVLGAARLVPTAYVFERRTAEGAPAQNRR
ncbi:glycosyltransferase family 39 protein [Phenylobacterium sp. LjRoot225]|uniref:hypothetical protein n=1 Tax=Phenylobacterium sp. LjRoot225 TaxID=3342285 RepID=UPI003ECC730F